MPTVVHAASCRLTFAIRHALAVTIALEGFMHTRFSALALLAVCSGQALGQLTSDYRVSSSFRTPRDGQWASDQSVGGADFRVHSRFLAVYYGGVIRQDNFTFSVQIDFRDIADFTPQFFLSPYNVSYDIYINNNFIGRAPMGTTAAGLAELTYQSRHPTFPELPVPQNWPSPISPGSLVAVYAASSTLPNIGDPTPATSPILIASPLNERYDRGDADHDGHVNLNDFNILARNFDPNNLVGPHIGPSAGDFTGDNRADMADYDIMVQNWDNHTPPPPAPGACIGTPAGPSPVRSCRGGSATFSVTASGTGPFTYQWRRNGVAVNSAANPSARTRSLTLSNIQTTSAGSYDCVVTSTCGSLNSSAASLTVCAADFNCDGFTDGFDYDDFVAAFETGAGLAADFNRDGFVDGFDYDDFVTAFEHGCP